MSEIVADDPSTASPVRWRSVSVPNPRRSTGGAQEELERRLDQARRDGTAEGLLAGRQDVERQLPATLENIAKALAELGRVRERVRDEAAQELVRLAVKVAARLIHRETVVDADAMSGLVRAAYLKLQAREVCRVRMHPALEPVVSKTLEQCGAPANLVLVPDTGLSAGELLFETSHGVLDASLDTQLRELERGLLDRLGRSRSDGAAQRPA